jgi:hypothetical protein
MLAGTAGTVILMEYPPVSFAIVVARKMKPTKKILTSPLEEAFIPDTVIVLPTVPLDGETVTVRAGLALTEAMIEVAVSIIPTKIAMSILLYAVFFNKDSADIFISPFLDMKKQDRKYRKKL